MKSILYQIKSVPVNTIIAGVGVLLTSLFGSLDTPLKVLLCFMALDILTGTGQAFINKNVNSSWVSGIFKKAGILVCVIIGVQLDAMTGQANVFRAGVCYFFVSNEGISILENLGKMGVKLPAFLTDALEQLQKKEEIKNENH